MKTHAKVQFTKDDIEYYFGFNLKLLSQIGLKFSMNQKTSNFTFLQKLPSYIFLVEGMILFILEVYLIQDTIQSDTLLSIQIMSQIISNLQSVSKGFLVLNKVKSIQNVLENLGIIWRKYPINNSDRALLNAPSKIISLSKIYWGIAVGLLIIYDLPPFVIFFMQYQNRQAVNHTYDLSQTILLLKYPFQITRKSTFFFLISQEAYVLYASGVYWIGSDALFAQFTTHICLQFKILKCNTKEVFNRGSKEAHSSLIDLIKRHRELLKICEMTEEIYSPIIFSTMLFSAINMCVNVVGVRETVSRGFYQETGIYLFLFVVTFAQILLFCIFAEKITEETRSLADLAYNLEWTKEDYKLRVYILLIILRAQKPFSCTAYGFFPIGHKKLTSIINASFSYYMMLQTMN